MVRAGAYKRTIQGSIPSVLCGCGRAWWDDGASGERAGVRVHKKNCIESVRNSATGNKKTGPEKKTMVCNVNNNEANIQ